MPPAPAPQGKERVGGQRAQQSALLAVRGGGKENGLIVVKGFLGVDHIGVKVAEQRNFLPSGDFGSQLPAALKDRRKAAVEVRRGTFSNAAVCHRNGTAERAGNHPRRFETPLGGTGGHRCAGGDKQQVKSGPLKRRPPE